jgi:nucleoside-diphosphate-sugar epimerase
LFRPSHIVHLAAETGTAQSLSQATRHGSVNVVGTTQLLDALSRSAPVPDQLVLASSRAVYGEGAWRCGAQTFYPRPRSHAQLLAGIWESKGPHRRTCGAASEVRRKDGRIVRGFVFIDDVVDALFAAIEGPTTEPRCLDIGSGIATTIDELARKIAASCDAPAPIVVPKSAMVTSARRAAPSSQRRTRFAGIRNGRSRTVCVHCWPGSASSPNCLSSQAITHMPQAVPQNTTATVNRLPPCMRVGLRTAQPPAKKTGHG